MALPFLEELEKEESRFKRFSMSGDGGVKVAGNLGTGYTINIDKEEGTGTPTTGVCCLEDGSCVIETFGECLIDGGVFYPGLTCGEVDCSQGACCAPDGTCSITTEEGCTGVYQGNGTTCDPNPCPEPTGACCVGEDCTIETEDDCTGMGGTYQGDDAPCDPNPCTGCVECAFVNPLGDGRSFLTATTTADVTIWHPSFPDCTTHCTGTETRTVDPETCEEDCTSDGFDIDNGCDPPNHFSGCGAFTCIGVYESCGYLPGPSISGDSIIYEYCCPDGCGLGGGILCECGTYTTTYSDEVTLC